MQVLLIDGHPDSGRLSSALLDRYEKALPADVVVKRVAVRDLTFDPNMRQGYAVDQVWEPDLQSLAEILLDADHVIFAFPLWWGAEPALLKGLLDRLLLPGHAFRYHTDDPMWDKLLVGRSADVIITMDTPPWYLRLIYGDAVVTRWKKQILGFVGFAPIRFFRFGPTNRGGAARAFAVWASQLEWAAASIATLRRKPKL
ncbi:MAG: hypothetical protein RLZZ136_1350 [Pseudomonadota bacterium]|jgi:putative NADPH-quinone reductase